MGGPCRLSVQGEGFSISSPEIMIGIMIAAFLTRVENTTADDTNPESPHTYYTTVIPIAIWCNTPLRTSIINNILNYQRHLLRTLPVISE